MTGWQRRKLRMEQGGPRYTEQEAEGRRRYLKAKRKRRWAEWSAFLSDLKVSRGCADCGYNAHPAALHFDHLPGHEKKFGLSRAAAWPWKDVLAEIEKCEVVCANCHAVRTALRRLEAA